MNHPPRPQGCPGPAVAVLLVATVACSLLPAMARAASRPPLVPEPAEIAAVDGAAELSARWTVRVPVGSAADSFAASLLIEDVRTRFGWKWTIADVRGPAVVMRPSRPAHRATALWNRQGYELEVWPDSIVVRAPSETGRYYGIQTLRQLVRGLDGPTVPGLVIRDGPRFAYRGFSDDISRGQMPTLEEFKRTLATLGYYKGNTYQLYIEDVFEFAGAPEIGQGRTRLPAADLTAIVEEGRRHHVSVIPIFETLGHQQRMLSLPHLNRFAETQPVRTAPLRWSNAIAKLNDWVQALFFAAEEEDAPKPWSFSPALAESRAFVKQRIDEIAAAAPGSWFHIGGDEAFDVGRGVSDVAPGPRRGRLLAGYFAELAEHLEKTHRKTLVYADELLADSAGLEHTPRDLTLVYWNYRGDGADSALRAIRSAGFPHVQVSPGLWDWATFAPNAARAFPNIAEMVRRGVDFRAEGVTVASWGDGGAEAAGVLSTPGVAYALDAAWFGAADSSKSFLSRFTAAHYGARGRGLAEAIEKTLWQEFPNVAWNGRLYHRVLQVKKRDADWVGRMRALDRDMSRARALLRPEMRSVRWNRDELEYWDHAARRYAFVATRDRLLSELADAPVVAKPRRSRRAPSPERQLAALQRESQAIRDRYETLWRARYRQGTLRANLERLDRQTAALDSIRLALFPNAAPVVKGAPVRAAKAASALDRSKHSKSRRWRGPSDRGLELSVSAGW